MSTAPTASPADVLPWVLAASAVTLEIAHPLVRGDTLDELTVATVVVFAAATVADVARQYGAAAAAGFTAVTAGTGFAVEAVGTRTGRPFGRYSYGDRLGSRVAGVPVVIPLAWTMMAGPALAAGRRVAGRRLAGTWSAATPLVAGWALASWDVFLDPQLVAAGHWTWADPHPALPGVPGVPLTNYAGWLAVSVVLMAVLDRLLPVPTGAERPRDGLPLTLYLWTYASSVLANVAFWRRPRVALAGGLAMGAVAAPLMGRLRHQTCRR